MPKNAYVMVSLEEDKAKAIGKIVSNPTSRKILNLLAEKELSESEIAKKLKTPISTIHYNIQQLMKADLIESTKFRYSEKGNEINIYSLARKLILIAPKGVKTFRDKIKNILPTAIIALAIASSIKLFAESKRAFQGATQQGATQLSEKAVEPLAAPLADKALAAPAAETLTQAPSLLNVATNYALFFLAGAIATLIIYLLVEQFRERRKNRKQE